MIPAKEEAELFRYRASKADIELLIADKKEKRDINCHVIVGNDPCSLSDFLDNLSKNGQKRTQLIFKIASGEHWSVMDIQRDKTGRLSIFFLDAIGHEHNLKPLLNYSKGKKIKVITSMGELQKDSSSCSIFCIDQAFHMSKIVDLHAQLAQVKKQDPKHKARLHVDPFDLPPVLVKNVQSVSFIGKYLTKHPEYEHLIINKKGQTLREYAASHYVTTADGTIAGAIQYKQQRYRTRVNKSKGYPEDPHYKEKLAAQAQNTIAQAIKKIDHLNVDFDPSQSLQEIHSALLLQLKKIRDSRPLKDAYTVLNLKKPPQALQEVIAKKQEQIDRLLFLSEMKFDKHLVIFIAKNDEMMEKAKKNPDYEKATQTTTVFCEALVAAMNKFLHARAEQPFKENLYDDCKMAIRNASKILHKHREWIGAIKKFLIDIAAFLTLGFSDGKLGIFAKTDSGQKLDAFEVDVVNQLNATG